MHAWSLLSGRVGIRSRTQSALFMPSLWRVDSYVYQLCMRPQPSFSLYGRSRVRSRPVTESTMKRAKAFEVRTESSIVCGFLLVSKCLRNCTCLQGPRGTCLQGPRGRQKASTLDHGGQEGLLTSEEAKSLHTPTPGKAAKITPGLRSCREGRRRGYPM